MNMVFHICNYLLAFLCLLKRPLMLGVGHKMCYHFLLAFICAIHPCPLVSFLPNMSDSWTGCCTLQLLLIH